MSNYIIYGLSYSCQFMSPSSSTSRFGQTKFSEEFLSTLSGSAVLLWRTNPNLLRQNPAAHVMLGLLDRSRSLPRDLLFAGINPPFGQRDTGFGHVAV